MHVPYVNAINPSARTVLSVEIDYGVHYLSLSRGLKVFSSVHLQVGQL
jgi:hypothetical protein